MKNHFLLLSEEEILLKENYASKGLISFTGKKITQPAQEYLVYAHDAKPDSFKTTGFIKKLVIIIKTYLWIKKYFI